MTTTSAAARVANRRAKALSGCEEATRSLRHRRHETLISAVAAAIHLPLNGPSESGQKSWLCCVGGGGASSFAVAVDTVELLAAVASAAISCSSSECKPSTQSSCSILINSIVMHKLPLSLRRALFTHNNQIQCLCVCGCSAPPVASSAAAAAAAPVRLLSPFRGFTPLPKRLLLQLLYLAPIKIAAVIALATVSAVQWHRCLSERQRAPITANPIPFSSDANNGRTKHNQAKRWP